MTNDNRHSPFIIKGLLELESKGIIMLFFKSMPVLLNNRYCLKKNKLIRENKPYPWCPELEIIDLLNGNKIRIGIDLQDWTNQFSYHSIIKCDVIYKRALTRETLKVLKHKLNPTIRPFGPNYSKVINDSRYIKIKKRNHLKNILAKSISSPGIAFRKIKNNIFIPKNSSKLSGNIDHELIDITHNDYIFFQVEYYDWNNNLSDSINIFRLEVIKLLKNHFGKKFIGGFYFNGVLPHSFESYRTNIPTVFEVYKKYVINAKIVISTNGFGESIPWKLVEYFKWGCAIVGEKNKHLFRVPLHEGIMQTFTKPEEVINKCEFLLANQQLILKQKKKSRQYYNTFIKSRYLMEDIIEGSFII